jgi:hypothetical protein
VVTLGCHPPHPAWDRLKAVIAEVFTRTGGDTSAGGRLYGLLRSAGLEAVRFRPFLVGFTSQDWMARFLPNTAASMREAILGAGLMSPSELDEAITACERHLADLDTISTSYLVYQAWGRKPASPS